MGNWFSRRRRDIEDAGFSHKDGKRVICFDCGLQPRLDEGGSPSDIHKELCEHCSYVQNNLMKKNACYPTQNIIYERRSNLNHIPDEKRHAGTEGDRRQEKTEKMQCKTCRESLRNTAKHMFLPCRHIHCTTCATNLDVCGRCGEDVIEKFEIFMQ